MLRLENVQKRFGSLVVSQSVDLHVERGQRHIIIGPNGAGKTTLINQIGGQMRPDSGRILLEDKEISQWPAFERARAGLARTFQKNTLFQQLSVFENMRLAAQARFGRSYDLVRNWRSRSDIIDIAERVIAQMNLDCVADARIAQLSYGDLRQVEVRK